MLAAVATVVIEPRSLRLCWSAMTARLFQLVGLARDGLCRYQAGLRSLLPGRGRLPHATVDPAQQPAGSGRLPQLWSQGTAWLRGSPGRAAALRDQPPLASGRQLPALPCIALPSAGDSRRGHKTREALPL